MMLIWLLFPILIATLLMQKEQPKWEWLLTLLLPLVFGGIAMHMFGSGMFFGYGMGGRPGMYGGGTVGFPWMALVNGLILLIVLGGLVSFLLKRPTATPPKDEALEALRLRLVRGEITPEEYENLRQLLIK